MVSYFQNLHSLGLSLLVVKLVKMVYQGFDDNNSTCSNASNNSHFSEILLPHAVFFPCELTHVNDQTSVVYLKPLSEGAKVKLNYFDFIMFSI